MYRARVSSKGKFHHGISVVLPNPLPRVDTAGSFIAYPKMPFNIALQHHSAATFHSRAEATGQMSSFYTVFPHLGNETMWELCSSLRGGNAQEETE